MINLKGYNFLFGKKAVSPVIGTILMVAVTVIMAAIVGGFVYQTARPKVPPAVSTSLADDPLVAVNNSALVSGGERIAKLYFEGGQNIAAAELSALVTYTDDAGAEQVVVLDGADWDADTPVEMGADHITLTWKDSDVSNDLTPGDRLDFGENEDASGERVGRGTDFTVKILHKATQAFVADHTIRVY